MLRVGDLLYGFCGGSFGRDSYSNKRVEAIGSDWVVAREVDSGDVLWYYGSPEDLVRYKEAEEEE